MSDQQYSNEDYQVFRVFLDKACGIVLGDNKQYLVVNRMRRIMDEYRFSTLTALVSAINQHAIPGLKEKVIDAMTTNETFWFRDSAPFDALRDVVFPRLLLEERRPFLRIWSAACSSGQEPYSISMVFEEFKQKNPGILVRDPEIVATDISMSMLNNARQAEYDGLSVSRGLSDARRQQFFDALPEGRFRLKRSITQRVNFKQLNLKDPYLALGRFDVVFCRNVLIYFAADLKIDILQRMRAAMNPGAYLFLGASESLPAALADKYTVERVSALTSVYRT
ncbi:MAG TPA: protein-glutamate O-methyltransferase CheR [Pseudohongiella sp.]|nr:protein-glutamate O-methyltransferase CheR [Pseudohongiella sp.]